MKGVKHYLKNGTVWKGTMHKMPDGSLHTNKTHTKTSQKLYHYGDLTKAVVKKMKAAVGGVATRNYRTEYDNYQGKPEQLKNRASRNAARGILIKSGMVSKGDNKDVSHRNGNPKNNSRKNLAVQKSSSNRSFARTRNAGKRNPYA